MRTSAAAFSFRTHAASSSAGIRSPIRRGQDLFPIKEFVRLSTARPNWIQINLIRKVSGFLPRDRCTGCEGFKGMARAHAANACVQSNSIKGLAQSIAKPAYRQAVDRGAYASPCGNHLIIAFLITICLGAFVRSLSEPAKTAVAAARPSTRSPICSPTDRPHCLDPREDRSSFDRLQLLLPGLVPVVGRGARTAHHRHRRRCARSCPRADRIGSCQYRPDPQHHPYAVAADRRRRGLKSRLPGGNLRSLSSARSVAAWPGHRRPGAGRNAAGGRGTQHCR